LRPIAPFFDLLRPFPSSRCAKIFNVILKKLKILRPLRPCALFVFRNKKARRSELVECGHSLTPHSYGIRLAGNSQPAPSLATN
jgi:hypothetical protein